MKWLEISVGRNGRAVVKDENDEWHEIDSRGTSTETIELRYLALAAPDLLAACEALHVRLFREQSGRENSRWVAPLELLSKAIAKAKGK